MLTQNDIQRIAGTDLYSAGGDKIGAVAQVYLDDRSGAPEWVTVKTGLFGTKETFVPLDNATLNGDRVEVPFGKDQVKDAPRIDADGSLTPAEEDELYTYYGLSSSEGRLHDQGDNSSFGDDTTTTADTTITETTSAAGDRNAAFVEDSNYETGHDTSGPSTDDAMTRSEERLVAGTRTEEVGKARLRKHVVTEQQQVTVPVTREEVTLDREPITDGNVGDALDGPSISEDEHEVVLHAERPVVQTETVAVERVRVGKQTVSDQETVSGEVRKEEIEFDGPEGRRNS